jgi:hypothetical protein
MPDDTRSCAGRCGCGHPRELDATTRLPIADGLIYGAALLGVIAVAITATLLAFDLGPTHLSEHAHAELSAAPLALAALAYLAHQLLRRADPADIVKSALLAAAFLVWAAYQLNPGAPLALNDLAIALFVLDIAVVIASDVLRSRPGPPERARVGRNS